MKKPFRTAIVGNLQALNVLLPAFQAVPDFKVVALCGRNPERLRSAAIKASVSKVYEGWEPLVDDGEIDVVALALPASIQGDAAVQLAKAGKHLFCEKPLAATLEAAKAVCDAVTTHQRIAVVNFGFRMVEAFRDFHAIVRSGVLGKPEFVLVEWMLSFRRNPSLTWNWKSDAVQGGGTLNMMGSHPLDYLRWFFGDIVEVCLRTATLVSDRPLPGTGLLAPVRADDSCNLLLTMSPDIPTAVSISTVLAIPSGHRVRAWFEKGLLELTNAPTDDAYDGFKLAFEPSKGADSRLRREIELRAEISKMKAWHPGRVGVAQRVVIGLSDTLAGRPCSVTTANDGLKLQESLDLAIRSNI